MPHFVVDHRTIFDFEMDELMAQPYKIKWRRPVSKGALSFHGQYTNGIYFYQSWCRSIILTLDPNYWKTQKVSPFWETEGMIKFLLHYLPGVKITPELVQQSIECNVFDWERKYYLPKLPELYQHLIPGITNPRIILEYKEKKMTPDETVYGELPTDLKLVKGSMDGYIHGSANYGYYFYDRYKGIRITRDPEAYKTGESDPKYRLDHLKETVMKFMGRIPAYYDRLTENLLSKEVDHATTEETFQELWDEAHRSAVYSHVIRIFYPHNKDLADAIANSDIYTHDVTLELPEDFTLLDITEVYNYYDTLSVDGDDFIPSSHGIDSWPVGDKYFYSGRLNNGWWFYGYYGLTVTIDSQKMFIAGRTYISTDEPLLVDGKWCVYKKYRRYVSDD